MELAEYGNSSALPAAAVYPRIALHQDLASFGRFQNPYPLEQVCSLFESAILLCQENGLLLEEAECRLNEMDEMFGLWNLDEDGRTNHPDRVWDQFVRMEEREADFARLPGSTGIYVRLAYYAFCLGDGRRLLDYYRKYAEKEMRYSLDHFAPHLRRYAVITGFLARACCFEEAVQKIQNGREVRGYAEEVREWFADPGAGDGKRLALLLGYFINGKKRQWIKTCEWREEKRDNAVTAGLCWRSWGWSWMLSMAVFQWKHIRKDAGLSRGVIRWRRGVRLRCGKAWAVRMQNRRALFRNRLLSAISRPESRRC